MGTPQERWRLMHQSERPSTMLVMRFSPDAGIHCTERTASIAAAWNPSTDTNHCARTTDTPPQLHFAAPADGQGNTSIASLYYTAISRFWVLMCYFVHGSGHAGAVPTPTHAQVYMRVCLSFALHIRTRRRVILSSTCGRKEQCGHLVCGAEDGRQLGPPVVGVLVHVALLLQQAPLLLQRLNHRRCALLQNRQPWRTPQQELSVNNIRRTCIRC